MAERDGRRRGPERRRGTPGGEALPQTHGPDQPQVWRPAGEEGEEEVGGGGEGVEVGVEGVEEEEEEEEEGKG